jgi:hypothetical protein
VLAVVEHQQQFPLPQVGPQQRHRLGRGLVAQVEGGEHRVADQHGIAHVGELDQEGTPEIGGDADGEPGLAHPARSDEGDQSRVGQPSPHLGQFLAAADKLEVSAACWSRCRCWPCSACATR